MNFFDTHITREAYDEVMMCLNSERLSEGALVKKFEQSLEAEFGMKNTVAVNSGTSALHLALILAGVGQGDEVILPAQTFIATAYAVLYCGATPVFADIGMDGNIDLDAAALKVTPKTKAITCVSWGGNPCELNKSTLIRMKGITLIQDNAQALGATYGGYPLSDYGDFSCYSFQAIKNLTTGDGGLLTCPDMIDQDRLDYERAKRLRWFGIDRDNDLADETGERQYNIEKLEDVGFKYHMNDLEAALGLGNLVGFKERQARVKEIAKRYDEEALSYFDHCKVDKKEGCSYWLYDMLVPNREGFMKAMKSRGVPVSVVHVGIDKHGVFGGYQDLPVQRFWDDHHVCLPIHAGLTDEDVDKVIQGVLQGW